MPPLHASSVQGLPSLQFICVPTQCPAEHVSPVVHGSPSSQLPAAGGNTQPSPGEQVSVVHGLLSTHTGGGPPTHTPATHVSLVVQRFPSSHDPLVRAVCWQLAPLLQVSSVHGLPSAQSASLTHTGQGGMVLSSMIVAGGTKTPPTVLGGLAVGA